MYYYIFDIKKCKKRSQVEEIKNYLNILGISGEFSYPTPMQNIKELVDIALAKKYTTIIGIGGDEIINMIAGRLLGRKEALGVIPLEASEELMHLLGTIGWKEACEALRFRKIYEMRVGQVASGSVFLTSLNLDIVLPLEVTCEFKDYIVQGKLKSIAITNYHPKIQKIGDDFLDIMMTSVNPKESVLLKTLSSLFGRKEEDARTYSIFHGRSLRIFTKTPMPLLCNKQPIAKTPQLIESSEEYLRLITARK